MLKQAQYQQLKENTNKALEETSQALEYLRLLADSFGIQDNHKAEQKINLAINSINELINCLVEEKNFYLYEATVEASHDQDEITKQWMSLLLTKQTQT